MRGIVTIACGPEKYLRWAAGLARSLEIHYPDCPRHLITDRPDHPTARLFGTCSSLRPEENGMVAKLRLDDLSPYSETLFVDADSVVFRGLDPVFDRLGVQPFSVTGYSITEGHWYADVKELLRRIDRCALPKFNSGLLYFRKEKKAQEVFRLAREIFVHYGEYRIADPQGRPADEPCFAIAMALAGIEAIPDDGTLMRTPIGMKGRLLADPVCGICRLNSDGQIIEPAILHYVSLTKHRSYASCRFKLHLKGLPLLHPAVRNVCAEVLAYLWSGAGKAGFFER
ncbi:MAG: hypothetical protein ABSE62_10560 [Chthoniobacteraceae bacterium]|jgi:hypothetical protein